MGSMAFRKDKSVQIQSHVKVSAGATSNDIVCCAPTFLLLTAYSCIYRNVGKKFNTDMHVEGTAYSIFM